MSSTAAEQRHQMAFFNIYVIALIVVWLPFKALSFIYPYMAILLYLILSKGSSKIYINIALIALVALLVYVFYFVKYRYFVSQNYFLFLITFSVFVLPFAIDYRYLGNRAFIEKLQSVTMKIILVQAIFAIAQGITSFLYHGSFDANTGDWISGTINPMLTVKTGSETVTFSDNMAIALMFTLPYTLKHKNTRISYVLGVLSLILASVMHIILILILSLIVGTVLVLNKKNSHYFRRIINLGLAVGAAMFLVMAVLLPQNLGLLSNIVQNSTTLRNPKAVVVYELATSVPLYYPDQPYIGMGPGQFSSRAALIGTGYYFGSMFHPKRVPFTKRRIARPTREFIWNLWLDKATNTEWAMGSSYRPWNGFITLYGELGLFGCLVVLFFLLRLLLYIRKLSFDFDTSLFGLVIMTCVLFMFLIAVQENYWEFPQMMIMGTLNAILLTSTMRKASWLEAHPLKGGSAIE